MRPIRLALEGVRSYTHRQEIDFRDAGLLAIVGDTGAGKSSILEALCVALYAATTWDKSSFKSLISSGAQTLKVELEFEADGDVWTVTRSTSRKGYPPAVHLLQRSSDGTRIDGAAAVNSRIEELVGLSYDMFLRAVVLPQGRFQVLLQATRGDRTSILKGIFRLHHLDEARGEAQGILDRLRPKLEELKGARARLLEDPGATAERAAATEAESGERVATLREAEAAHRQAVERAEAAGADVVRIQQARSQLADPESLTTLRRDLAELERTAAQADERIGDLRKRLAEAGKELDGIGERLAEAARGGAGLDELRDARSTLRQRTADVERLRETRAELGKLEAQRAETAEEVDGLADTETARAEELATARTAAEGAAARLEAADSRLEEARREDAAAHAAADCSPGDPCPVCARDLPEDWAGPTPGKALEEATKDREAAAAARRGADAAVTIAAEARQEIVTKLRIRRASLEETTSRLEREQKELARRREEIRDDLVALAPVLGSTPAVEGEALAEALATVESRLEALAEIAGRREALSGETETLRRRLDEEGERRKREIDDPLRRAWESLTETRASSLALTRALERDEPVAVGDSFDPEALAAAAEELEATFGELEASGRAAADEKEELREEEAKAAAAALETVDVRDAEELHERRVDAEATHRNAERERREAERQIPIAADLDERLGEAEPFLEAVEEVRRLLADGKFVAYVVERKQRALLGVASQILGRMTRERYGFSQDFEVVDRIAGEARDVKTLSGGETFLASLALALGLVELAGRSGGRLEALFLDEGFGTLDANVLAEALDALHRQAEKGRMVAVISHLRSVAENIEKVLFVRKTPSGSEFHWLEPGEREDLVGEDAAFGLVS